MANDSAGSRSIRHIGIECEALEGPTWGMGRQVRKLLEGLVARQDLKGRYRFILYSNGPLSDDPLFGNELFIRRPCGLTGIFGSWAPLSFSVHYYLLLPLRLWWDSFRVGVRAMYYPNYMLPIIHPPHVRSLVMLTDDIFREAHNPSIPFRHRIAYQVFALFWAKRRATRIMAISHASGDALRHLGIAPERITVNEMGVIAPAAQVQNSKLKVQISDFLFVGQAFERRHLKETLESFARIAAERPSLTFRFIGTEKYSQPTIAPLMERINASLGRPAVTHATYVPDEDLAAAYRTAGTIVYVSDTEGFGMPPLEALSYGTPPVVADTPVNREIYGSHAFFVPTPISAEGIERAMRRAIDDVSERERIKTAGASIVSRYSWQAHADRFIAVMEELTPT